MNLVLIFIIFLNIADVILEHFPDTASTNIPFVPILLISFINWTVLSITVMRSKNRTTNDTTSDNKEEKFKLSNVKVIF